MPPSAAQLLPAPLTPEQWAAEFRKTLMADLRIKSDPDVLRLLSSTDGTFNTVVDSVRRFCQDFWAEANSDRAIFGAELRQDLPSAIAEQTATIKILEKSIARLDAAGFGLSAPIQVNTRKYLLMARLLLAHLDYMNQAAPAAFSVKSLGYSTTGVGSSIASDLQTLYWIHRFLIHRLGKFPYNSLATLLDCGFVVEGIDKEVYDGKNLKNRLDKFQKNNPHLAEQTEADVRSIPRVQPCDFKEIPR